MSNCPEITPQCVQIFKRLEEKIDTLIDRDEKRNGKYDEHIKTSTDYRIMVERHEMNLKLIRDEKLNTQKASQYRIGIVVGLICSIPGFAMVILKLLEFFK